jgi:diaminopimelate epimerase
LTTNVAGEGRRIRNSDRFKQEGTNVNFVEPLTDRLIVRSYERGVEDETLSCGTGVVASVLAASSRGLIESEAGVCKAIAMGGILMVHYEKASNGFKNIWLEGEATFVYKGEIEIV